MAELFDLRPSLTRFTHFCAVFNCTLQLTGNIYDDVIFGMFVGPIVHDKRAKFHQKPSEASFRPFFERRNFRPEVPSDIISGAIVEPTDVDVLVKFVDSRSNDVTSYFRSAANRIKIFIFGHFRETIS